MMQYGRPPIEKVLTGHAAETTNNRMELMAAAEALEGLSEPCRAAIHSDSAYLVNAFNDRWIDGWQRRGWKKSDKKPVLNRVLKPIPSLARRPVMTIIAKKAAIAAAEMTTGIATIQAT